MGENKAIGQSILGRFVKNEACFVKDDHLLIKENLACLYSFNAEKFKYVHGKAFDYNKCKFGTIFKPALMVDINGEKKYAL